jgi:hypothetical protein
LGEEVLGEGQWRWSGEMASWRGETVENGGRGGREAVRSKSLGMILLGRSIDNQQLRCINKNDRMAETKRMTGTILTVDEQSNGRFFLTNVDTLADRLGLLL